MDNLSSLTKNVIDKALEKVDKVNDFSNNVIDKSNDTVSNTSDSLNNIVGNISSFTNIFKSENIYLYIAAAILFFVVLKKI